MTGNGMASGHATSYEMDDFQSIAAFEVGVLPFDARNDFEVQLDRYAIGFHSQMIDQRCQSKTIRKFALVAVEEEKHTQASSCWLLAASFWKNKFQQEKPKAKS